MEIRVGNKMFIYVHMSYMYTNHRKEGKFAFLVSSNQSYYNHYYNAFIITKL